MKLIILSLVLALAFTATNAKIFSFGSKKQKENYNFEVMPNHKNYTMMARFIVHNANWTSVAYKSFEKDTLNLTLSTIFSTSDGLMSNGSGTPYFYLTELEPAVKGLVRNDSKCGLMMTLATTGICQKFNWNPEDPRCARVFLTGYIQPLKNNTAEYEFAKKAFTTRHPNFVEMPGFHKFFFTKYVIQSVKIISGFGGVRVIPLKEYYACKDSKFNLMENYFEK